MERFSDSSDEEICSKRTMSFGSWPLSECENSERRRDNDNFKYPDVLVREEQEMLSKLDPADSMHGLLIDTLQRAEILYQNSRELASGNGSNVASKSETITNAQSTESEVPSSNSKGLQNIISNEHLKEVHEMKNKSSSDDIRGFPVEEKSISNVKKYKQQYSVPNCKRYEQKRSLETSKHEKTKMATKVSDVKMIDRKYSELASDDIKVSAAKMIDRKYSELASDDIKVSAAKMIDRKYSELASDDIKVSAAKMIDRKYSELASDDISSPGVVRKPVKVGSDMNVSESSYTDMTDSRSYNFSHTFVKQNSSLQNFLEENNTDDVQSDNANEGLQHNKNEAQNGVFTEENMQNNYTKRLKEHTNKISKVRKRFKHQTSKLKKGKTNYSFPVYQKIISFISKLKRRRMLRKSHNTNGIKQFTKGQQLNKDKISTNNYKAYTGEEQFGREIVQKDQAISNIDLNDRTSKQKCHQRKTSNKPQLILDVINYSKSEAPISESTNSITSEVIYADSYVEKNNSEFITAKENFSNSNTLTSEVSSCFDSELIYSGKDNNNFIQAKDFIQDGYFPNSQDKVNSINTDVSETIVPQYHNLTSETLVANSWDSATLKSENSLKELKGNVAENVNITCEFYTHPSNCTILSTSLPEITSNTWDSSTLSLGNINKWHNEITSKQSEISVNDLTLKDSLSEFLNSCELNEYCSTSDSKSERFHRESLKKELMSYDIWNSSSFPSKVDGVYPSVSPSSKVSERLPVLSDVTNYKKSPTSSNFSTKSELSKRDPHLQHQKKSSSHFDNSLKAQSSFKKDALFEKPLGSNESTQCQMSNKTKEGIKIGNSSTKEDEIVIDDACKHNGGIRDINLINSVENTPLKIPTQISDRQTHKKRHNKDIHTTTSGIVNQGLADDKEFKAVPAVEVTNKMQDEKINSGIPCGKPQALHNESNPCMRNVFYKINAQTCHDYHTLKHCIDLHEIKQFLETIREYLTARNRDELNANNKSKYDINYSHRKCDQVTSSTQTDLRCTSIKSTKKRSKFRKKLNVIQKEETEKSKRITLEKEILNNLELITASLGTLNNRDGTNSKSHNKLDLNSQIVKGNQVSEKISHLKSNSNQLQRCTQNQEDAYEDTGKEEHNEYSKCLKPVPDGRDGKETLYNFLENITQSLHLINVNVTMINEQLDTKSRQGFSESLDGTVMQDKRNQEDFSNRLVSSEIKDSLELIREKYASHYETHYKQYKKHKQKYTRNKISSECDPWKDITGVSKEFIIKLYAPYFEVTDNAGRNKKKDNDKRGSSISYSESNHYDMTIGNQEEEHESPFTKNGKDNMESIHKRDRTAFKKHKAEHVSDWFNSTSQSCHAESDSQYDSLEEIDLEKIEINKRKGTSVHSYDKPEVTQRKARSRVDTKNRHSPIQKGIQCSLGNDQCTQTEFKDKQICNNINDSDSSLIEYKVNTHTQTESNIYKYNHPNACPMDTNQCYSNSFHNCHHIPNVVLPYILDYRSPVYNANLSGCLSNYDKRLNSSSHPGTICTDVKATGITQNQSSADSKEDSYQQVGDIHYVREQLREKPPDNFKSTTLLETKQSDGDSINRSDNEDNSRINTKSVKSETKMSNKLSRRYDETKYSVKKTKKLSNIKSKCHNQTINNEESLIYNQLPKPSDILPELRFEKYLLDKIHVKDWTQFTKKDLVPKLCVQDGKYVISVDCGHKVKNKSFRTKKKDDSTSKDHTLKTPCACCGENEESDRLSNKLRRISKRAKTYWFGAVD